MEHKCLIIPGRCVSNYFEIWCSWAGSRAGGEGNTNWQRPARKTDLDGVELIRFLPEHACFAVFPELRPIDSFHFVIFDAYEPRKYLHRGVPVHEQIP